MPRTRPPFPSGCARGPARTLLALAFGLAGSACRPPTEITLEIDTDARCEDLGGTTLSVGALDSLESRPASATTTACHDGRIGSLVVVPSDARDDEVAIRVVTGLGVAAEQCVPPYGPGCIVARRVLRFIPHEPLTLHMSMRAACAGVPCSATQTCSDGQCVDAHLDSAACTGTQGCDLGSGTGLAHAAGCGDTSGLAQGSPWPMGGACPTRIGRSTVAAARTPRNLWSLTDGTEHQPCIGPDGTLYVTRTFGGVVAVDAAGHRRWEYPSDVESHSGCALDAHGAVYFGSSSGALLALDRDTGALRWRRDLEASNGFVMHPAVTPSGQLLVACSNGVRALDAADGSTRWTLPTTPTFAGVTLGFGGRGYVVSSTPSLIAFDAERGTLLFERELPGGVFAYDHAALVGLDGTVYVAGSSVHAVDGSSGELLWSVDVGGNFVREPALSGDGTLVVASDLGLVGVSTREARESWRVDSGDDFTAPVVDAAGRLYATTYAGPALWTIDAASGAQLSTLPLEQPSETQGAIGADGTLYFTLVSGGTLAAFGP